jgi:hypothetical protein
LEQLPHSNQALKAQSFGFASPVEQGAISSKLALQALPPDLLGEAMALDRER